MITAQARRKFKHHTIPNRLKAQTPEDFEIIEEWQVGRHDKGSIDVEIGLLSRKIKLAEEQLKQTLKEGFFQIRRNLIDYVHSRRKKLDYLRNTDTNRYYKALGRLKMSA
jgi:ribosomal protein S15